MGSRIWTTLRWCGRWRSWQGTKWLELRQEVYNSVMEALQAHKQLLLELAALLGAVRAELDLVPDAGDPAEQASGGPADPDGELSWLEVPAGDGPGELGRLRLGFPAGATPPSAAAQRLAQSVAQLALLAARASQPQDSLPARERAGRRILAVTEEELQRIILDIHDGPVQNLFAALSQIELLRRLLDAGKPDPSALGLGLQRLSRLLENSLSEIKTGLGTFRPPGFRRRSLVSVLRGLVMQHENSSGMRTELTVVGEIPSVGVPVKIALYRILQEALSNVARHAHVDRLDIYLSGEDGWVVLRVIDAGLGFDPPPLDGPLATEQEEHIGLRGMRDRTELIAGRFKLTSRPGHGTHIEVRVPGDA
jgi:signal transduction histidine kinase